MERPTHDTFAENAAPYALDALEPEEARTFEEHLRGCASCRSTIEEMRSVIAMLPFTVDLVEPPPHVKQQLMRQVRSTPVALAAAPNAAAGAAARYPAQSRGTPWLALLQRALPIGVALASVVLVLGLAALLVRQQRELDELRRVQAIVGSPGTVVAPVSAGEVQAKLYMLPDSPTAYLVVDGLPRLPADRDFQIWMLDEGGPVSVGVHHPEGGGRWLIQAPQPMREYDGVGITQEPRGGSPAPTTEPILAHQFG